MFKKKYFSDTVLVDLYHNYLMQIDEIYDDAKGVGKIQDVLTDFIRELMDLSHSKVFSFIYGGKGSLWQDIKTKDDVTLPGTVHLKRYVQKKKIRRIGIDNTLLTEIADHISVKRLRQGLIFCSGRVCFLVVTPRLNYETLNLIDVIKSFVKLALSRNRLHKNLTASQKNLLAVQAQLTSRDLTLRKAERSLKKRGYEINNLLEMSGELYSILNKKQLINSALLTIVGQIGCQRTFAMIYEHSTKSYSNFIFKGWGDEEHEVLNIQLDHPLVEYLIKKQTPVTLKQIEAEKELKDFARSLRQQSIEVLAPVIRDQRLKAIFGAGEKLYGLKFDDSDMQIFAILVNIIAISLSNAQMYEEVEYTSLTDAMTELYNYRYFENRLREEINRARRNKGCVSMIMLDIDYFKHYNDALGHQAGDEALRGIGQVLRSTVRDDDIVTRYGGEEFAIISPNLEQDSIQLLAERIRENVEKYDFYKAHVQPGKMLTVSLGGASFPDNAVDFEDLVSKADKALYKSKGAGRNRFTLYNDSLKSKTS